MANDATLHAPDPFLRNPLEWFLRRQAIARAKGRQLSSLDRQYVEHALRAAELAALALKPNETFASGEMWAPAISLYREALYWLLQLEAVKTDKEQHAESLKDAFTQARDDVLLSWAGSQERLASLRIIACDETFVHTAKKSVDVLRADALLLSQVLKGALAAADEYTSSAIEIRASSLKRIVQTILGIVMAALALYFAFGKKTDLAPGKNFRASSAYPGFPIFGKFDPSKPVMHKMQFHTMEEDSPFVELDLGEPREISKVVVLNRSDCCADRAVPLLVEVALTPNGFREVARKNESFTKWEASFQSTKAKWVRLRVPRRSMLHLDGISIY